MSGLLARYYALLYIVFTKGQNDLGKGVSLIVFDEKPLVRHFMKVFGINKLREIQGDVFRFLEQNLEDLKYYYSRVNLLKNFEEAHEIKLQSEIEDIIRTKLRPSTFEEAESLLNLYAVIDDAVKLLSQVVYGYGVVATAGCSALVKPEKSGEALLLQTLSEMGLAIHLPKDYNYYITEYLSDEDHFIIPCIILKQIVIFNIKKLIEGIIAGNHKSVQKALEEIGEALGYEARHEVRLDFYILLDVAWFKSGTIAKAFEVQFRLSREGLIKALHNLERALRKGAETYLVVPNKHVVNRARTVIREDMLELADKVTVITADQLVALYKAIKSSRDIIKLFR